MSCGDADSIVDGDEGESEKDLETVMIMKVIVMGNSFGKKLPTKVNEGDE